jgi:hypothetical protein
LHAGTIDVEPLGTINEEHFDKIFGIIVKGTSVV